MSIGTEVCDSPFAGRDSHQSIDQKPCKMARPKPEEVAHAIREIRADGSNCNAQAYCAKAGMTLGEMGKVLDILGARVTT